MIQLIWNSRNILLPSPDFGNTLTVHLRQNIHQAMSGDYWTYRTTPVRKTISMNFSHINRNKALELQTFVIATAGQRILLKDHNNEDFSVRLLNPYNTTHAAIRDSRVRMDFEIVI